jgi:hypothetical protein
MDSVKEKFHFGISEMMYQRTVSGKTDTTTKTVKITGLLEQPVMVERLIRNN